MLSRRLTPGQRLMATPIFILVGLFSLAAGHALADHMSRASAVVTHLAHSAQNDGSRVIAPTASPSPTPHPVSTTPSVAPKTVPVAVKVAPSDDGDNSAGPNPHDKGGHAKRKGHGKGHHKG